MQIDMIRGMVSNLEADIHAGKLTRDQAAKGLEIVSSIVNGVLFSNKELSFREKKAFNSMQKTITSLSEFVAKATQASVSNVGKVAEKAKII